MSEFASAGLTAGQLNAIVKKLGGEEGAMRFLQGQLEVVVRKHLIDLNADPSVPNGWSVVEHRRGGEFEWNPEKVRLHLSPSQRDDEAIGGLKLREELANEPVFNANLMDFLLANPHLIPEEWKGKAIFFWGTVYRDPDGRLVVRYLYWGGSRWRWGGDWLDYVWGGVPALVLAS
jgi:hypothetical protein